MEEAAIARFKELFGTRSIQKVELVQTLWSGYGKLSRWYLSEGSIRTVIAKEISFPSNSDHPRAWNTNTSHLRKVRSYQVEVEWYNRWAERCTADCHVPECFYSLSNENQHLLILEDLDASGFSLRKSILNIGGVKLGLKWLANFHAVFMNELPGNLWKEGTYWHLSTRPDELAAMKDVRLKKMAAQLDKKLSNCQFQTLVHGDAKVANFCFSEDMKQLAAVDFQYVGGGCGMKDVIYFLSSCIDEEECEKHEAEFLDYYFDQLKLALAENNKMIDFDALEEEWRAMYIIAWADFIRFLLGWMPSHHKINNYSLKMIDRAIGLLKD